MVKPDGVARNLVGEIISRFEVRADLEADVGLSRSSVPRAVHLGGPEPSTVSSPTNPRALWSLLNPK